MLRALPVVPLQTVWSEIHVRVLLLRAVMIPLQGGVLGTLSFYNTSHIFSLSACAQVLSKFLDEVAFLQGTPGHHLTLY